MINTLNHTPSHWDQEVDLLVFGAGTAGMTAALMANEHGLDVLLCEKTAVVGGISATSGGTTWVPGTTQSQRAGVPDTVADAATFLKAVVGERGGEALRDAFLASGPQAIDELERISDVKFVAAAAHPDYVSGPGAAFGGRALAPLAFDGRLLGKDFARVRPPRPEFMGLGGMGSQLGVILAAVVMILLPEMMRDFSEYRMLLFGALMVLMMIWRPQGLLPMQRPHLELRK